MMKWWSSLDVFLYFSIEIPEYINLLLMKLCPFFLQHVQQSLRTFQNLVESAPSFLDGLVVLITCAVLFGEGLVDDLKPISKRLHLLLDLPFFFLLLVDQVLNFCALLFNALHHFRQFHIGVIEIPWSHFLNFKLLF